MKTCQVIVQNVCIGVDRFFIKVLMFFFHAATLDRHGY
jgi:hypothetical protein